MSLPDFDELSPNQVRAWGEKLAYAAQQFREIRATLVVNCEEGRALHDLGIRYDDSRTVLNNLVAILDELRAAK